MINRLTFGGTVICALALAGSTFFFYSKNKTTEAELATLRIELNELARLRTENLLLQNHAEELERLKKENLEIHKLRNAVQQLEKEKLALTERIQQLQLAKTQPLQMPSSIQDRTLEAEKNREEGRLFLEENAKKPGVVTTASGLQFTVLQEGTGSQPTKSNTVSVHYEGTLVSGKVFDSSYQRQAPAKFPVTALIKGWTEGLQLMKEGSKYKFFIPSDLAYGSGGTRGIGPNSTLIFEVELLKIEK